MNIKSQQIPPRDPHHVFNIFPNSPQSTLIVVMH